MFCSLCAKVNPDKAQFCTNCGAELKRPALNFFSVLGIGCGSILSISVVGGIIGTIVGVIYVSSSSDFQDDGSGLATFFAFLIVLVFLGGGALVGAILGVIVGIVISLRSIPNKTKGDYFRVIGVPLLIFSVIFILLFGAPIYDELKRNMVSSSEIDKIVSTATEYVENNCNYINTFLISSDRTTEVVVSQEYQLIRPVAITEGNKRFHSYPHPIAIRYKATTNNSQPYTQSQIQSLWQPLLSTRPNYIRKVEGYDISLTTTIDDILRLIVERTPKHAVVYFHQLIPRIVHKNNSIPGDNSWQYINYEFMVLENEVIGPKNFCYNDKEDFSDLIIELLPENSSVSKN